MIRIQDRPNAYDPYPRPAKCQLSESRSVVRLLFLGRLLPRCVSLIVSVGGGGGGGGVLVGLLVHVTLHKTDKLSVVFKQRAWQTSTLGLFIKIPRNFLF